MIQKNTSFKYTEYHMAYGVHITLVTKQLLGNVFKTFQNGWILVEMLSLL